jgi:diguanylate cyclase (GGDEF)-like protein
MDGTLFVIYAVIGYPLLAFGLLEAWLGLILIRARRRERRAPLHAGLVAASSALFCISAGLAYVLASWGVDNLVYQLAYRSTWSGWFVTVASLQLVFYIDNPESRLAKWAGWVLWPFWGGSYLLVLTTDIFGAHATQLIPCVAQTAPLEMPARILGGSSILVAMAKCAITLLRARGFKRLQFSFFLAGLLLFGLTGLLIAAIFQLAGITSFDPALASFGSVPWVLLTFYAITKYRLFDIKSAVLRILAGVAGIALAALAQLGLYMLFSILLPPEWALVISFFVLGLSVLAGPRLSGNVEKLFSLVLYRQGRYHRLLSETAQALTSILDLDQLMAYLAASVRTYLDVDQVALLLPDEDGSLKVCHAVGLDRPKEAIPPARFLRKRLEELQSSLQLLEEKSRLRPAAFHALEKEMQALQSELAVPVLFDQRVQGVLALGEKTDGRAFVKQDFEALEALAGQAAVALENARLYHLAIRDGMTGLYHRSYFRDRLLEEMARARRYQKELALILIDIDHFKSFNDRYGHLTGDTIIQAVARILRSSVREGDLPARYGGEEFAVILPESGLSAGIRLAQRLRELIAGTPINGHRITVSAGVTALRDNMVSPEALIQEADQAMYKAKRQGRNRVCTS